MNKSSTEDSEDSKTTLYNNIKVDTCDYIFAQTTESQTPKGNLCKLQTLHDNDMSVMGEAVHDCGKFVRNFSTFCLFLLCF